MLLAWRTVVGIVVLLGPQVAVAQDRPNPPLAIARLTGPIKLDGFSDEPAWQSVAPLSVVQSAPTFGGPPSERTEMRIAYDDQFLYASGRMYDRDVSGIRATSLRRDDGAFSNDWFVLNLDTYNDKENMLVFGVNPAGVRTDVVFGNDALTAPNFSWNAFWDAAVVQTDSGWYAEIRIPLSSIRFQQVGGHVTMGVTVWRRIARRNEMISFPAIPAKWGAYSLFKASQAQEISLDGVHRRNAVYVTPYVLGGVGNVAALNVQKTAYDRIGQSPRDGGGDLKYGITSNLTLDLTYNTDFAQVEADDQQVNLTRFSLFFPEKRPFFQERASAFESNLGGSDQLFYSRRIGLNGGAPVPLYGGARVVGRVGPWEVGVLDMQAKPMTGLASQNLGVARVRRQVWNSGTYIGAIVTQRDGGGSNNDVYGVDGLFRLASDDFLTLNWAHTNQRDTTTTPLFDRAFERIQLERRGADGLAYTFSAERSGSRFTPDLGFLQRGDFARLGDRVSYGWLMPKASSILRNTLNLRATGYQRNRDKVFESVAIGPEWSTELKSGRILTVGVLDDYENLTSPFKLSSTATVPAGSYRYRTLSASFAEAPGALFRLNVNALFGHLYDGTERMVSASPTWIASRYLELSGLYQVDRVNFDTRAQSYTARIARLRAKATMNTSTSLAAFVQYNSAADLLVYNVRFRYNPREGTDLYVVVNEGRNTRPDAYSPVRFAEDSRTLLVKFSRTLNIELR